MQARAINALAQVVGKLVESRIDTPRLPESTRLDLREAGGSERGNHLVRARAAAQLDLQQARVALMEVGAQVLRRRGKLDVVGRAVLREIAAARREQAVRLGGAGGQIGEMVQQRPLVDEIGAAVR